MTELYEEASSKTAGLELVLGAAVGGGSPKVPTKADEWIIRTFITCNTPGISQDFIYNHFGSLKQAHEANIF